MFVYTLLSLKNTWSRKVRVWDNCSKPQELPHCSPSGHCQCLHSCTNVNNLVISPSQQRPGPACPCATAGGKLTKSLSLLITFSNYPAPPHRVSDDHQLQCQYHDNHQISCQTQHYYLNPWIILQFREASIKQEGKRWIEF